METTTGADAVAVPVTVMEPAAATKPLSPFFTGTIETGKVAIAPEEGKSCKAAKCKGEPNP